MIFNKMFVTPSPNEIESMVQQQTSQRRKIRLQQVRQQGQVIAKHIRASVDERRQHILQDMASELNKQYIAKQQQQLTAVKEKYSEGLSNVGKAHNCAAETDTDQALLEAKFEQKKMIAKERFNEAINQLREIRSLEEKENIEKINRRRLVTHKENVRAKRIAMLPKPEKVSEETTTSTTTRSSTTRSSTQSSWIVVERAAATERNAYEDAKKAAAVEEERYRDTEEARVNSEITRREKAKVRHLAALQQARMQNEYRSLENDLRYLQQKDARKRRENIPSLPHVPSLDVSLQDLMI